MDISSPQTATNKVRVLKCYHKKVKPRLKNKPKQNKNLMALHSELTTYHPLLEKTTEISSGRFGANS